jgi:HEAT repeat protein
MPTIEELRYQKWIETLNDTDAEMSRIAAEKLAEIGNPAALYDLVKAMETRTATVAQAAAVALGDLGDTQAVGPLMRTLLGHTEVGVRSAAARALGRLGDEEAIPALKAVIDDYKANTGGSYERKYVDRGLFTACIDALRAINTTYSKILANKAEKL